MQRFLGSQKKGWRIFPGVMMQKGKLSEERGKSKCKDIAQESTVLQISENSYPTPQDMCGMREKIKLEMQTDARLSKVMVTKLKRLKTVGSPQFSPFPIIMVRLRQCYMFITQFRFPPVYTENYISQLSPLELDVTIWFQASGMYKIQKWYKIQVIL